MLEYQQTPIQRWIGRSEDGWLTIWMRDATFQRYVEVYLKEQQGIQDPTQEQRQAAVEYCRKLEFWLERDDDPDVHILRWPPNCHITYVS